MIIQREIITSIEKKLDQSNKIIILYGPRQVGKTTLVTQILKKKPYKVLEISADEERYHAVLSSRNKQRLLDFVAGYDLFFLDEAQRIPDIGINIKILHEALPTLRIILTGSSSLDLASRVSEPLTGRAWTYTLWPISQLELSRAATTFELQEQLQERMVFGSYPEVFSYRSDQEKTEYLVNLSQSYLYRDVLELGSVKNTAVIRDLLKLLAFQIGSEVSLSELASTLGIHKDTVNRYITLLEQAYVIFRLSGFSRNLRKEVTKMDKIYFVDLGIRNVLIDNLKRLYDRDDVGKLWENFLIVERRKRNMYFQQTVTQYFWRVYTGGEVDLVEDHQSLLHGYELKWQPPKKALTPSPSWTTSYPDNPIKVIHQHNYLPFVTT